MQQSQLPDKRPARRALSVPVLVPLQPKGSRRPLFCVTAAYGDMLAFGKLARLLGPEQPFLGLQPPFSPRVQPATATDLNTLVAQYIEAMRSRQPYGPYLLAGYCSGGLVAFEMARQLQAQGDAVDILMMLDTPYTISMASYLLYRALQRVAGRWLPELTGSSSRAVQILHATFKDEGLAQHMRLLAGYRPAPYQGRVAFFIARQSFTCLSSTVWRWRRVLQVPFEVHVVPGTHESFLRSPHVRILAERMERSLAGAELPG